MRTLVIGCNHRSARVALRERLAFDEASVPRALRSLVESFPGTEAVLLSTCNRLELYLAHADQGMPRIGQVIDFLAGWHDLAAAEFAPALYSHEDVEAARHLFRVVSSLDSMVLGESQILGQAKAAYETARQIGTVGRGLDALFRQAFSVAKEIHTRTGIATGRVSVGSTAVDLARQIFSRFEDKIVLMVGAGKMGEMTLRHLLTTNPKELWVTNRTDPRAADLAARLSQRYGVHARVIPFAEWIDRLAEADIVISSTGSREPILKAEDFAPIPARRRYRSLLLIDIAVPRDIDVAVAEQDCVFLYNIDDLQTVTEKTLARRRGALDQCHEIIEAGLLAFAERLASPELGPLIDALNKRFQEISDAELARIIPKLENASDRDRELIRQMLHRVTQKILNHPLQLLNDTAANGAARVYADTLRAMFDVSPQDADDPAGRKP